MPTNMVDGYVRRDSNVGSQEAREQGLVLPDGLFMPSQAFRNNVPQTEYTLAELGVDLAASPFAPEVHPVPESSPAEVKVRPVEVDWRAEAQDNSDLSCVHITKMKARRPGAAVRSSSQYLRLVSSSADAFSSRIAIRVISGGCPFPSLTILVMDEISLCRASTLVSMRAKESL